MTYYDALEKNGKIIIKASGSSMRPFIRNECDTAVIEKLTRPPRKYDVVLFRRPNGENVLHRVIKAENGVYALRGDGQVYLETGITQSMIYGIMTGIYRKNKLIYSENIFYTLLSRIWCALIIPRKAVRFISQL